MHDCFKEVSFDVMFIVCNVMHRIANVMDGSAVQEIAIHLFIGI